MNQQEPWMKEFDDKICGVWLLGSTLDGDIQELDGPAIKAFIQTQITKARQEERERIAKEAEDLKDPTHLGGIIGPENYQRGYVMGYHNGWNNSLTDLLAQIKARPLCYPEEQGLDDDMSYIAGQAHFKTDLLESLWPDTTPQDPA